MSLLIADGFIRQMPSGAFIAWPSATKMIKVPEDYRASRCPHCQHLNLLRIEQSRRASPTLATFRCEACARVISAAALTA